MKAVEKVCGQWNLVQNKLTVSDIQTWAIRQSGGRPKALKDIQKAARYHTDLPPALKTLRELRQIQKRLKPAQIAAFVALLDRKPLACRFKAIDALNTNVNYAVGEQPMRRKRKG